ncbi:761_t:CDS:1, partial [Funneliformis geosporum]
VEVALEFKPVLEQLEFAFEVEAKRVLVRRVEYVLEFEPKRTGSPVQGIVGFAFEFEQVVVSLITVIFEVILII